MFSDVSPKFFVNFIIFINSFLKKFNGVKNITLDIVMTLGPAINYFFQAMKFNKTKSSIGYSNYVCLVTMLAHTTKIFFWFGKKYVVTLLVQSILVILIQLYILHLSVKYKKRSRNNSFASFITNKKNTFLGKIKNFFRELCDFSKIFKPNLIWKWDKTIEFYKFYFFIIAFLTILLFIFGIHNKIFANIIGYINLVLELLSSLPQIIELCRTKNQRNISKLMVILWLTGNLIKIYYNYYNHSPIQLILGASVQAFFNIILIGQIIYYYRINRKENLLYEDINTNDKDKEKENNANTGGKKDEKNGDIHLNVKEKIVKETEEKKDNNVESNPKNEGKEEKEIEKEKEKEKGQNKITVDIDIDIDNNIKKEEDIKKEEETKKDESDDDIINNNKKGNKIK